MGWLTTLFSPQRALAPRCPARANRGFLRALDSGSIGDAESGKLGVMSGFLDGTAAYVLSFT